MVVRGGQESFAIKVLVREERLWKLGGGEFWALTSGVNLLYGPGGNRKKSN